MSETNSKPWYKKWWIILLGLIVIGVIIGVNTSNNSTNSQVQRTSNSK